MTLAAFADAIVGYYVARGAPPARISTVRMILHMLHTQGIRLACDLDAIAIGAFEESLKGKSVSYRNGLLRYLRGILNAGHKLGLIGCVSAPSGILDTGKVPPVEESFVPSRSEIHRFLEWLRSAASTWEGHRLYALVATAVQTGLCRKEAVGGRDSLRIEDIDLAGGIIRIRRRERDMPNLPDGLPPRIRIPDALRPVLEEWLPMAGSVWAFPGNRRSGPWPSGGDSGVAVSLRLAAQSAGVEAVGTYTSLLRFFEENAVLHVPGLSTPAIGSTSLSASLPGARALEPAREITLEEAARLMMKLRKAADSWDGHRLFALAGLELFAGLSFSELVTLGLVDVDLERGRVAVPGRLVPEGLNGEAADILGGWLARPDRGDSPFVFPGDGIPGPWDNYAARRQLQRFARDAGIPGRVTLLTLPALWRRQRGRVDLGPEWHSGTIPEPRQGGPRRRGPGGRPRVNPPRARRLATMATRPDMALWDPDQIPAVRIGSPDDPVHVRCRNMGPIPRAAYEAIRVLLGVFPGRLGLKAMNAKCGSTGWRRALERLRETDPAWIGAIGFPGDEGSPSGYGILNARTSAHIPGNLSHSPNLDGTDGARSNGS